MSKRYRGSIVRGIIILVMALLMLFWVFTRFYSPTY